MQHQIAALIPRLYQGARLEHLSGRLRQQLLNLPKDRGVYLWGEPGRGKTYALAALAVHWIEMVKGIQPPGKNEGEPPRFIERVTFDQLCCAVRSTYHKRSGPSEEDMLRPLWRAGYTIIEDLGVSCSLGGAESDSNLRILLAVLDRRIEDCRPTFFTSNKAPNNLGFDKRVESRLAGHCEILHLTGPDRRLNGQGSGVES